MRSLTMLVVVAAILFGTARAQESDLLPAKRYITSFHFRVLNGGIILGKARLEPFSDSLSFIFDTGCGGASLDSATASHYHLTPRTSPNFIRGIAGKCPQKLL